MSFKHTWAGTGCQRPYAQAQWGPRSTFRGLQASEAGQNAPDTAQTMNWGQVGTRVYRTPPQAPVLYGLAGITRDSAGAVLGSCVVSIYRTQDRAWVGDVTSDPSTGAWTFAVTGGSPFFLVEYKTGSPDKAGTSVNTLVATRQ